MSHDEIRRRRVELRASSSEDGVVTGYVTTFDSPYAIGRGVREIITRSTFDTAQAIPLCFEHDWASGPIGVSRSITADNTGLKVEFELFLDDPRARSVYRAMKAGALREFSVGFIPDAIEQRKDGDVTTETITKGDLIEVSSVLRGANPETSTVSVRAVPPMAPAVPGAAPPPVHPDAVADPLEEKPTKASLLAEVAKVVEMGIELGMGDQLPKIVQQYLKILDTSGGAPVADPNAAPPPVAPGAPPAAAPRSQEYVSPALIRALAQD